MILSDTYNMDCMIAMAKFPDKRFDLAIVDPPYGIKEDGRKNHTRDCLAKAKDYSQNAKYDNQAPDARYFKELFRVSKNQIIWGGNYFGLPPTPCFLVWDKNNGNNDFADCELAWASFKTAVRLFKFTWNGMLQEDMKNKENRIHPNHKPIPLYRWLLNTYAKQGDKILDTHLGSGSSRIACYDLGFDFTGYELDKEYFDAQEKRFKDHIAQQRLF